MEVARLILDYISVLVWPAAVVIGIVIFRRQLQDFFSDLIRNADEFEADILGVSTRIKRTVKEIAEQVPDDGDRSRVTDSLSELELDEIRVIAKRLESRRMATRISAGNQIQNLVENLSKQHLLELADSPLVGERVASGISLNMMLHRNRELLQDPDIGAAISSGLRDPSSFVRFRYAQIASTHDEIADQHQRQLIQLASTDSNRSVKAESAKAVRRMA